MRKRKKSHSIGAREAAELGFDDKPFVFLSMAAKNPPPGRLHFNFLREPQERIV